MIRYGDEIGMGDDLSLEERNAVRTPMQWSNERQAGFSEADDLVHPLVPEGPYAFDHVNVESQRRDPGSLLNWMTSLIRLRKECPEIGWGEWRILDTGNSRVLGMSYSWRGSSLVTLHNFDERAYEIVLDLKQDDGTRLVDLLVDFESEADREGSHHLTVEAYGYRWFRSSALHTFLHQNG